jgi:hypothetical protein
MDVRSRPITSCRNNTPKTWKKRKLLEKAEGSPRRRRATARQTAAEVRNLAAEIPAPRQQSDITRGQDQDLVQPDRALG